MTVFALQFGSVVNASGLRADRIWACTLANLTGFHSFSRFGLVYMDQSGLEKNITGRWRARRLACATFFCASMYM